MALLRLRGGTGQAPLHHGPALNHGPARFTRVYEEHVWRVYGFFAYRVEAREVAEDLTQITFERALRAWSRFDPRRASEAAWLIGIARNLLIDHHRRDRSSRLVPIDEQTEPAVAGPEEHHAASSELIEALAQLPERDREVIALRFGGDLSGPEIAKLMDMSLGNVQQVLSRSLRRLRERLSEPAGGQAAEHGRRAVRSPLSVTTTPGCADG